MAFSSSVLSPIAQGHNLPGLLCPSQASFPKKRAGASGDKQVGRAHEVAGAWLDSYLTDLPFPGWVTLGTHLLALLLHL